MRCFKFSFWSQKSAHANTAENSVFFEEKSTVRPILFRRSRPKAGVAGIETAFAFQNGPTTTTTTNRPPPIPGRSKIIFLLTLEKSMIVNLHCTESQVQFIHPLEMF